MRLSDEDLKKWQRAHMEAALLTLQATGHWFYTALFICELRGLQERMAQLCGVEVAHITELAVEHSGVKFAEVIVPMDMRASALLHAWGHTEQVLHDLFAELLGKARTEGIPKEWACETVLKCAMEQRRMTTKDVVVEVIRHRGRLLKAYAVLQTFEADVRKLDQPGATEEALVCVCESKTWGGQVLRAGIERDEKGAVKAIRQVYADEAVHGGRLSGLLDRENVVLN